MGIVKTVAIFLFACVLTLVINYIIYLTLGSTVAGALGILIGFVFGFVAIQFAVMKGWILS